MSIAIVTDTACNITPEQAEELGIYLLPLEIVMDGETYKDGFEINTQEFYEKNGKDRQYSKNVHAANGRRLRTL